MKKENKQVKPESILYEVIENFPALRRKIGELFGKRCLSCPSSKRETIAYTAFHKGLDPDVVVRDLNSILLGQKKGK
ncbi:MAG: disulfide oxidoreductase [Deltaproteobacteria bacterium]|nr:disulfide oxidoreductase [Deltaproteobacteria bacterium]NIS76504.1 disulfide oxidoreductase [Deltaproteobacteria bacterium]